MDTHFKTIGLIGKQGGGRQYDDTLVRLVSLLNALNFRVIAETETAKAFADGMLAAYPLDTVGQHCDLVIAIGGDGTFLGAARAVMNDDIPLIGVNLGRLGFLVDISPAQLLEKLRQILQGQYQEEVRYLLQAEIIRDGEMIHRQIALNEVVVHRWVTPSMIEIITHIDGVYLNTQRSDGLIIATPTGSTAYALSGGGPILHPSLNVLVLVPLNPHTLSNRPIVMSGEVEIAIAFSQAKQINALVTCDHLEIPGVLISDKIIIKKAPKPIRILHPQDHDFFTILRDKLNWSHG